MSDGYKCNTNTNTNTKHKTIVLNSTYNVFIARGKHMGTTLDTNPPYCAKDHRCTISHHQTGDLVVNEVFWVIQIMLLQLEQPNIQKTKLINKTKMNTITIMKQSSRTKLTETRR